MHIIVLVALSRTFRLVIYYNRIARALGIYMI